MKYRISSSRQRDALTRVHDRGFTLVELLVTISVAAILVTIAVPGFSDFVKNNRMVTQANDFVTSLNLARSEAVRRGSQVVICKSANGAGCSGAGGWEQGWIVFVDTNANGGVDGGEPVLRVHGALASNMTLRGSALLTSNVAYLASGASQAGTLVLCDDRGFGANARAIQVSPTGRVSSTVANAVGSGATGC